MENLLAISNNLTTIIVSVVGLFGIVLPSVINYLTFKRTGKIEKKVDGIVAEALHAKDEEIAAKAELLKEKGKAEGIAEKQKEVDQLNKEIDPNNHKK